MEKGVSQMTWMMMLSIVYAIYTMNLNWRLKLACGLLNLGLLLTYHSGKPAAKPAAEKPAAEKPAAEKPAAEKPAAEKPAAEKPAAEKPAAEKPAAKPEDEPAEPVDDFERAKLQMNNFYMGLDDKEKIIKSVQINVIKPIFDKLSPRKKKELNFGWGRIQRSLPHNIDELKSYLDVHLLDKLSEIIDRKQKEILEMLGLMSEDS